MESIFLLTKIVLMVVLLLLMVAFLSLFERKFLGFSQNRMGPNIVGQFGLFQPFADAMKLISKIDSSPEKTSAVGFFFPPVIFFFVSLSVWVSIPVEYLSVNFHWSGLFLIFWMSIGVYSLIFSGWFSFSKFSTLGLCRAISQTISYEIVLTFCFFGCFLLLGSVNLNKIFMTSTANLLFFPALGVIFFISLLAESNRIPFDLPESESELVGGYSVEYGSVSYTILFLGENLSLLFSSLIVVIFFLGKTLTILKFSCFLVAFLWIRSTLPRVRFDKIMNLCWLELIPSLIAIIFIYSSFS